MTSIAKQSNFTFTFFASTMQWPKAIKHLNKKYLFFLEENVHGNRKEKRDGRQKMKAAITSSEHVSLVGRGKSRTRVTSICILCTVQCAPPDFSSSGIQNPLLCNHDNVLLN